MMRRRSPIAENAQKVGAGADFFKNRAVCDLEVFGRFMEKAGVSGRPLQAGLAALKSPRTGRLTGDIVSGNRLNINGFDSLANR